MYDWHQGGSTRSLPTTPCAAVVPERRPSNRRGVLHEHLDDDSSLVPRKLRRMGRGAARLAHPGEVPPPGERWVRCRLRSSERPAADLAPVPSALECAGKPPAVRRRCSHRFRSGRCESQPRHAVGRLLVGEDRPITGPCCCGGRCARSPAPACWRCRSSAFSGLSLSRSGTSSSQSGGKRVLVRHASQIGPSRACGVANRLLRLPARLQLGRLASQTRVTTPDWERP